MAATCEGEADTRDKLLKNVKKEVKQLMEEAVTRKFVHEESSSIMSLSGAVEACLLHGLKKRALGLFKLSTTTALLQKVAKGFEPAAHVMKTYSEIENLHEASKKSSISLTLDGNRNQSVKKPSGIYNPKYLWIRIALFEKQLAKILDYLVKNWNKYYEEWALIADGCDGPILSSLLVGPCALEYTKMKTTDHLWTDPPADELVQRHRIHSGGNHHITRPDSPKRPGLQIRRHTSSSSEESMRGAPVSAKEYVESLHQNSRVLLLYGKNNVHVQPKEDAQPLPGYLSLHQSADGLTVKWTPNQLMGGGQNTQEDTDKSSSHHSASNHIHRHKYKRFLKKRGSQDIYWDYALAIHVDEIVYLHCHQQPDSGGTLVLVGQDGVQHPPIHFPKGGHLLAFLSCLENGLLPHGQLDPPLWSQRGKGKVFPKLRKRNNRLRGSSSSASGSSSSQDGDLHSDLFVDEETTDYVFRIITTFRPENMPPEILDTKTEFNFKLLDLFPWQNKETNVSKPSTPVTPETSVHSYARAQQHMNNTCIFQNQSNHRATIKQLCDTMRKQILSRAFYGWLAHRRHLKTVRTHLSGLVNSTMYPVDDPCDAACGLSADTWAELYKNQVVEDSLEVNRLTYYGGVAHEIRKEVWPYLLEHYTFGSTPEERQALDQSIQTGYEQTMSEWLAVEAIVKQREKESALVNLSKYSSGSTDTIPLVRKDSSLSNDVFFDGSLEVEEFHPHEPPLTEESSTGASTPMSDQAALKLVQSEVAQLSAKIQEEFTATTSTTATENKEKVDDMRATIQRRNLKRSDELDSTSPDEGIGDSLLQRQSTCESKGTLYDSFDNDSACDRGDEDQGPSKDIVVTYPAAEDVFSKGESTPKGEVTPEDQEVAALNENAKRSGISEKTRHLSTSKESLASPASPACHGAAYTPELLDSVALNLHRIDKDVQRCDRNYHFFTTENLEKLRNIMCTYVWENLDVGYVQGMCDLLAPLLVIFDDEALSYSCFKQLMKRMSGNFPHGGAMDTHFANMRSLIQILDSELFEHMHQNGDYTHFYFCYRWFLLDFKRELVYDDVFSVWETIWSACHISSSHFVLFIALALVEYYREIIMDNNMDFTDIIKFFNEMAEHHNAKQVLAIARDLVYRLQNLIENK